jgi:hypothetical protein
MAIPAPVDLGDRVRVGNHSGDAERTAFAVDPTAVVLRLRRRWPDPADTATYRWPTPGAGEQPLTREDTGRFYADVTADVPGLWGWKLEGTGAAIAADQGHLIVRSDLA